MPSLKKRRRQIIKEINSEQSTSTVTIEKEQQKRNKTTQKCLYYSKYLIIY